MGDTLTVTGINSPSTQKHTKSLPPRRGQIKIRIFRTVVKSAAAFSSRAAAAGGDAASLTTSPSSSPSTPSGYNSDS